MSFLQQNNFENQNAFFNDPLLIRHAAHLPRVLLGDFKEIGDFVSSNKAHDLARLANLYVPKLSYSDRWGRKQKHVEIHPAYHALVRRSKRVGLSTSLWENDTQERNARYQARAIRLFLIAGLENGHLSELITTNAGIGALITNDKIYNAWKEQILSRQHDSSELPKDQKKGISFAFAFQDKLLEPLSEKKAINAQATILGSGLYQIKAMKNYVANLTADAFFVTAHLPQGVSCFFVPRFLEDGSKNNIKIDHLIYESGYRSCPLGEVNFDQSRAWLLGKTGDGQKTIDDIEMMLRFDEAVVSAGNLRAALQFALTILSQKENRRISPLTLRIFADIALDIAAAQALVMRLARAFDLATADKNEAAFARIMTTIAAFWIHNLVTPIINEIIAQLPEFTYEEGAFLPRFLNDGVKRCLRDNNSNLLVEDVLESARKAPRLFKEIIALQGQKIQAIGSKTNEVLYAAMEIALNDLGAGRLLVEQLAYSSALAALYEYDMTFIAESFAESRLGGQWRSSYGMLSVRRSPEQILSTLYPMA